SGTDITGWTEGTAGDWISSATSPINGTYSLKHNLSAVAGTSYLYSGLGALNLATTTTTWQFQLANGAWDPSGGNKFWVFLIANETNLTSSTVDGYAVGVNLTGTTDMLTLWKVTNGAADVAVVTSTFDWNSSNTVGIEVTRTTAGLWDLKYDANGGFDALVSAGTATNTDYTTTTYFGLEFTFTSTRAGLLRMDDVNVTQPATCTAPTTQPTGISFTSVTTTSMTVNWSGNGDGDGRLVVVRAGSAVAATPTNGTAHGASATFGSGDDLGASEFVVYRSTGSSVNVTGLSLNTTYHYAIYEYNNTGDCYLIPSPLIGNQATVCGEPTTAANSISFSNVTTTTMDVGWTNGTGDNHLVVVSTAPISTGEEPVDAATYTANTTFGSGTALGSGFVVYNSTGNSVSITGLTAETFYYVAVFEFSCGPTDYLISSYPTGSQYTYCAAPSTVFFQGFEGGGGDTWSITVGAANISTATGAGDTPASQRINTASNSWQRSGGTATLELSSVDVSSHINTKVSVRLTSTSKNSSNGADGTDDIEIFVALDGGAFPATADITINGATNSRWGYDATLTTSTTAGTPVSVTSPQNATSTNNYATAEITVPDAATSVALKIIVTNNNTNEVWNVDDIDLTGCVTPSITTGTIAGSPFCVTSAAGASVSVPFTSSGTFSSNTYTAQLSNASGSFATPINIGTLVSDANSGTVSATIPAATASGTGYRIRVLSNSPPVTGANNGTNLTIVLGPENVTLSLISEGNNEVTISWTNSATCFDEILIVGKASGSVTASPSGDGTAYTANSVFATAGTDAGLPANEYAVYKSTGTTVTVTSLTNLTNYCFTVFTRKGTLWSSGVSDCATPSATTILEPGDLAILAVNANNSGTCGGGSADDEISFVCFKDLRNGVTLEFTDNGWERCNAGQWGNTEGTIRITRTGGTITAGTVMTLYVDASIADAASGRYDIIDPADAGWTFTELNFSADFNMNAGGDQVYFMQGGTWAQGTSGDHDATYTGGEILYGFNTKTTWAANCATNPTQNSNLYNSFECISMAPTSASDYNKYTGPTSQATQREWISRIGTVSNWTNYGNCTDYYAAAPDYNSGYTIAIDLGGFDNGKWSGPVSTDWFDCNNWEGLRVPVSSTNAILPSSGVTFEPLIATAGAVTNNLDMESGRTLTINATGSLTVSGNFTNNATLTHTAGTVTFDGSSAQTLGGSSPSTFFNFTLNNSSATGVTLASPVTVNSVLTLTDGFLFTDATNILKLIDGATSSAGSAITFVDGPMTKVGNEAFVFPAGDGTTWARISITAPTTATTEYTAQYFATGYGNYALDPGSGLTNVSQMEYWTLDQLNNDDVQVTLHWENDAQSGITDCDGTPDDLRVAHWSSGNSRWELDVDGVNLTGGCPTAGSVQTNANQPNYSPFTFSSKSTTINPLPIKLLHFDAAYNFDQEVVDITWATSSF
ncbi:MAG: hypothetical protein JKX74_09665, partial [Flavobacteriales bacterium]|nr:hypothetical protein [Flavobacteriales bacterium]